eukprot:2919581-Pyramimonas_sp.AAC.1
MAHVCSSSASLAPVATRKGRDHQAVTRALRMPGASRPELSALRMASRSRSAAVRTVTTAGTSRPGESATETLARRFGESLSVQERALVRPGIILSNIRPAQLFTIRRAQCALRTCDTKRHRGRFKRTHYLGGSRS